MLFIKIQAFATVTFTNVNSIQDYLYSAFYDTIVYNFNCLRYKAALQEITFLQ